MAMHRPRTDITRWYEYVKYILCTLAYVRLDMVLLFLTAGSCGHAQCSGHLVFNQSPAQSQAKVNRDSNLWNKWFINHRDKKKCLVTVWHQGSRAEGLKP